MGEVTTLNPAEEAASLALASVYSCIDTRASFVMEAGAGAGKTHSLVEALRYVTTRHGRELMRKHQRIACITYTNVACDEIKVRLDSHPVVQPSTIHAFCWSMISNFQSVLRDVLPSLNKWAERIEKVGTIGPRSIVYELGYPNISEAYVALSHNDVLALTVRLLEFTKFRSIWAAQYPWLFIDEYQDTNREFASALTEHFLGCKHGPVIGFFGDHWQKIYEDGIGRFEHPALTIIPKGANFRSVNTIVDMLNRMRPELVQAPMVPTSTGHIAVYHTNSWSGTRRSGAQWSGDLPSHVAHDYLDRLRLRLSYEGWDFSPETTKVLMLTHKVLAEEQGYAGISEVFTGHNDSYIRKEHPHFKFFVDFLEPVCTAFESQNYADMFAMLGGQGTPVRSRSDKSRWKSDMATLVALRKTRTIGEVIDALQRNQRIHLPEPVLALEHDLNQVPLDREPEKDSLIRLRKLRSVSYCEVSALAQFLNDHTPFGTKHGAKGAEFENVLVVLGRGWNQYNFNQMLEWISTEVPEGKQEAYERNRNLFYVVCSRPKKRLALLFTQVLSSSALRTLEYWFGTDAVSGF